MSKRKLPIGIQTFREVREEDCYYVDKTAYIRRLLDEGKHYFLSRPRRFGKSLFLDTLKEAFEGNEPLFAGLHLHDQWDWSVRHPVLRLDFSNSTYQGPDDLQANLIDQLTAIERRAGMVAESATVAGRFAHQLEVLHERSGQRVVVLVDEYDKPILDALEVPEVARANRDLLRGLYSTVKFADAHIRFTFITGVSKFSKVSLFSGLNNLKDITLDVRYSALCATRRRTWTRCSHQNCLAWTGSRSATGTTAIAGLRHAQPKRGATRRCTIPSTSCCCSTAASSKRIGLRRVRRRSWSRRCSSGALVPSHWVT